jgi:hypothetical protein
MNMNHCEHSFLKENNERCIQLHGHLNVLSRLGGPDAHALLSTAEVEHDAGVGIYSATGTARLGSDIERADIDGVGDGDIEAERDDGSSAGVGSGANLIGDQLGVGGGADHTSADLEVGPEWNVMGYKANAKGNRAGRSALGTGTLGQPQVKTHRDPAGDGKVVEASDKKARRTRFEGEGGGVNGFEAVLGDRAGTVNGDLGTGGRRETKNGEQAEREP